MLHPAGMALFGQYNITNNVDLSITLESLVKSLGIGLEDTFRLTDGLAVSFTKVLDDSISTPSDSYFVQVFTKALSDSINTPSDTYTHLFTKGLSDIYSDITDSGTTLSIGKALTDTSVGTLNDAISVFDIGKSLTDIPVISESLTLNTAKYVEETSIGTFTEAGQVWKNPYQAQDYFATTTYVVGLEQTFT
jgi:hypothetical protein